MKSILVYSTQLLETGGIESHLLEFCRNVATTDVLIDLVVANSYLPPETENFYKSVCRRVVLGKSETTIRKLIWLASVGIKLSTNRYDAIYTNGQGESITLLTKVIRYKLPWIHHHHTSGEADDQNSWGNNYRVALVKADVLIACSALTASKMSSVLHRSVDTIPCFSRKIETSTILKTNNNKIKFGYYGRLIPEKGIDILCKLSKEEGFADIEFHLWGEGNAYPSSFFIPFKNVTYHGAFSSLSGLTAAISSIDALLLISTHPEGLPISLLEAMSAGLPWLATNRGGIPDIAFDPNSTRVIPVSTSYEKTKMAIRIFADDILAGKVSREVQRKIYDEKFSAPALLKRWIGALQLESSPK